MRHINVSSQGALAADTDTAAVMIGDDTSWWHEVGNAQCPAYAPAGDDTWSLDERWPNITWSGDGW